jgi:hypothetical protein
VTPATRRESGMRDPTLPKNLISCCGMVCAQGTLAEWECPACHTVHVPGAEAGGPAGYVPLPPSQMGAPSVPLPLLRGGM